MISEEEKARQEDYERICLYRRVFNTPDGREVLTDIMGILGLNATIESEDQAALHNAALTILSHAGMLRDWNSKEYIESLFTLPYTPPEPGDKE
jgi:hypothetical protein